MTVKTIDIAAAREGHPRAATLLREVGLALPTMRVEIEVVASTAKA